VLVQREIQSLEEGLSFVVKKYQKKLLSGGNAPDKDINDEEEMGWDEENNDDEEMDAWEEQLNEN